MSQADRDLVGTLLLRTTLLELFQWRFMQTDPNWGNFMYDEPNQRLHLIDFGAATEFPKVFVDDYVQMVRGCALRDRAEVLHRSTRLGFLTGLINYRTDCLLRTCVHVAVNSMALTAESQGSKS